MKILIKLILSFQNFRRLDRRTLLTLLCLAKLLSAEGSENLTETIPLFTRVVTDSETALGGQHPFTLTAIHEMADCLFNARDAASAEILYRRALNGRYQGNKMEYFFLRDLHLYLFIFWIIV